MCKIVVVLIICLCVVINISGQELNVIPNLLKPYFRNAQDHIPINLMANISEKIFHTKKMGFRFGKDIKYC